MKTNNQVATAGVSPGVSSFFTGGMLIVLAIAFVKLLLHCVFNNRYGYFRDEFDFTWPAAIIWPGVM